jgi:four helix bundle protein
MKDTSTQLDLKDRTKLFAKNIILFYKDLPRNEYELQVIGKQLLRAGTSVGANTRAAFRGRSTKEFVAKLGIVIEEADECGFWLELITEFYDSAEILPLTKEANELVSIFVSVSKTTKEKIKHS